MAVWAWLLVGGPKDGEIIARTVGDYSPHNVARLNRAAPSPPSAGAEVITYSAKVVEQFPGGPRYRILAAPGVKPGDCEEPIRRANFKPYSGGPGDGR